MTIAASIMCTLAVLLAIYTGIFWTLAVLSGDPVIHNRIMSSSDPTGFQKWLHHDPRKITCLLTALTGGLLVLSLIAIC